MIPLQIAGLPVVKVYSQTLSASEIEIARWVLRTNSLPVWIVARPKRPPLSLKLVREYQVPLLAIKTDSRVCVRRGLAVDQCRHVRHHRHLARRIDPAQIVAGYRRLTLVQVTLVLRPHRHEEEHGYDPATYDEERAKVEPSSPREKVDGFALGQVDVVAPVVGVVIADCEVDVARTDTATATGSDLVPRRYRARCSKMVVVIDAL